NAHNLSETNFKKLSCRDDLRGFTFFPAIIKPADSQGQRGVYLVKNRKEASQMLPESLSASRNREAIIEELIQGPEISVHVFVIDSELKLFIPSDRHVWEGPAVGLPAGHVMPSRFLSRADLSMVKQLVQSCIQSLGITNGPLYFQMKICPEHGPKIIEIAPRLDGCHMWRLVEFCTGVNLIKACFDSLSGLPWQHSGACEPSKAFSLWFHLQKTGDPFIKSLHTIPEGANCVHEKFLYHEGQTVRFTNGVIEKVGYYILQDQEPNAAKVE
uniref:ATP-grasp domain-containing protein n=1 Tax=Candidatus Electrothrix sp. TaxID=2170559 RepID=UPI004056CB76